MRIIISPAKKMAADTDSLAADGLPALLERTERLKAVLQEMSPAELQALWKCNDAIAKRNVERLSAMDLRRRLTPAILSYEGIQYQYMAPRVMETAQLDYLQEHLRILSGFYGLLRPLDGVTPYRLEMQARLPVDGHRDLYGFWGGRPGPTARRRDGFCAQPGLQGVQPRGGAPLTQIRPFPHLHLWRMEGRQNRGKRHDVQDGPGPDGALAGGERRHKLGRYPGV